MRSEVPDNATDAALLLDNTITGCAKDPVPEIRSLGTTLAK